MNELREDISSPRQHIYVLVTSDGGFLPHLEQLHQAGFQVCLVSNFDSVANKLKNVRWLEMWTYFSICRGDVNKILGKTVVRGTHPTLKYQKKYAVMTFDDKNFFAHLEPEEDPEEEEEGEEDYEEEFPPLKK